MKKLLLGLLLLSSAATYSYDCTNELEKNTENMQLLSQIAGVSEEARSLMFRSVFNARALIELVCGLKKPKRYNALEELEEARQIFLHLDNVTEEERLLMLEQNSNSKRAVEILIND